MKLEKFLFSLLIISKNLFDIKNASAFGKSKTMQDHHWIEQSRIKDKKRYPFLQQPPMRTNLLKDDSNLSLIIGHNGGHTANYNTLLDSELDLLKSRLSRKYKNIKVTDYMKYDYIVIDIENSVPDIISKLKNKLKIDEGKIGNLLTSNKIYILD